MDRTIIKPIPDRVDMAEVAQKQFYRTGYAIEVGVYDGTFAQHNLKFWKGSYTMCDNWGHRKDGSIDKNMEDNGSWEQIYHLAVSKTIRHAHRVRYQHKMSVDAAKIFPDNMFDWIYIDTLHDYNSVKSDLNAWYPKLRPGGLFSGDDYGDKSNRWAKRFGEWGKIYGWGVIHAVNEFCEQNGLQLNVTWMNDKSTPAWYLVKPE